MTTSISGSAPPTPPALIPLNLCGTGGRRIERDVTAPDQGRYLDVDLGQFKESDDG